MDGFFVRYGCGQIIARQAQELGIGTRQPIGRQFANDQHAENGWQRLFIAQHHLRRGQFLLVAALVGRQHVARHQGRQVLLLKAQPVEVGQLRVLHGLHIERTITVTPPLIQDALVLRRGQPTARPPTHMDATLVACRRRIAGPDGDHGHFATLQLTLLHQQGRRRHDVAVGFDVCQLSQQFVADGKTRHGCALVVHANQHHAGFTMARQIVGEGANRFAYLLRRLPLEGLLALGPIRLQVGHHGFKLCIGEVTHHSYSPSSSNKKPCAGWGAWLACHALYDLAPVSCSS